jgi:hypothetical protein
MQLKFLVIPSVLLFQVAAAQNNSASLTSSQPTSTPVLAAPSAPVEQPVSTPAPASNSSEQTLIVDYKSVYETATVEEEVKMAAERFSLSPSQQDIWLAAAAERRQTEKQAREILDSKTASYEKESVYRGLRTSLNTFQETIAGYLTPAQKQAVETDRLILEEKRKRLAKLPPPPPTPTVTPVDSSAIMEADKDKGKGKKSKKKKKTVAQ